MDRRGDRQDEGRRNLRRNGLGGPALQELRLHPPAQHLRDGRQRPDQALHERRTDESGRYRAEHLLQTVQHPVEHRRKDRPQPQLLDERERIPREQECAGIPDHQPVRLQPDHAGLLRPADHRPHLQGTAAGLHERLLHPAAGGRRGAERLYPRHPLAVRGQRQTGVRLRQHRGAPGPEGRRIRRLRLLQFDEPQLQPVVQPHVLLVLHVRIDPSDGIGNQPAEFVQQIRVVGRQFHGPSDDHLRARVRRQAQRQRPVPLRAEEGLLGYDDRPQERLLRRLSGRSLARFDLGRHRRSGQRLLQRYGHRQLRGPHQLCLRPEIPRRVHLPCRRFVQVRAA